MKQQIMDRFPGISCAWMDAAGKETTACFGFADQENHVFVDENNARLVVIYYDFEKAEPICHTVLFGD